MYVGGINIIKKGGGVARSLGMDSCMSKSNFIFGKTAKGIYIYIFMVNE